jgi:hypothetical protein
LKSVGRKTIYKKEVYFLNIPKYLEEKCNRDFSVIFVLLIQFCFLYQIISPGSGIAEGAKGIAPISQVANDQGQTPSVQQAAVPGDIRRYFGLSAFVGIHLFEAPQAGSVEFFKEVNGSWDRLSSGTVAFQAEGFLSYQFSLYGEFSITHFRGEGDPNPVYNNSRPQLSERFFPITMNARYAFCKAGSGPFVNAGFGIAPGLFEYNAGSSSVTAAAIQFGGGVRKYFGKWFGLTLELKYQYLHNGKEIENGASPLDAGKASFGVLSILGGIYFL